MVKEQNPGIVSALQPQLELMPDNAKRDLQKLVELKGYSLVQVTAGWWIRFGEVQTLQIENEFLRGQIKDLLEKLHDDSPF